jgi:integrase
MDYIDTLRAAGSDNRTTLTQLRALDRLTETMPLPLGTIDETFARAWLAPSLTHGPNTLCQRYYLLRRLCRFLVARRPQTFVPGESLRARRRPAPPPHIYTREEIRALLDGALRLRDWERTHPCPIRSKTMHMILVLLVTTGLRISEALRLTLADVDLDEGVLSIHQTKFRKSRLVPVSPGTLAALRHYHNLRATVPPLAPDAAFFVSGQRKAYSYGYVHQLFCQIAREAGIRPPSGAGPRLHDCRHTFAVTRLMLWYREGANVMACLPLLTTYLGHACVSDTEVYLQATTDLLAEADRRFHRFAVDFLPQGGAR